MNKLLTLLLLFPTYANADIYATPSVGVFNSAKYSRVETMMINVGIRREFDYGLVGQLEGGFWIDRAGKGREGSGYMAYQMGVETANTLVLRLMAGPAVITNPDAYLGGSFPQFTEDLFIGFRGTNKNTIGVKYKHISSAGIFSPNIGRDFIGVEAAIRF